MRCKFCFATFQDVKSSILPKGHLCKEDAIHVVKKIAEFGFEKITFAGGEPTLCPWLAELVQAAKLYGMTTMIVTNGTRINPYYLKQFNGSLDWIALSIDSISEISNINSGRAVIGRKILSEEDYHTICSQIKEKGVGLKINTVVHRLNKNENMSEFIQRVSPKRWKILQVLQIDGQNDLQKNSMNVSLSEFNEYIERHQLGAIDTVIVSESNDAMTNSYCMVDPAGRFFDNLSGFYCYSKPILEVGVETALNQVRVSTEKFIERGGLYSW